MSVCTPHFGPAHVRVATAVYDCDLNSNSGRQIPLGVLTEVRFGGWYGLGLTARSSISSEELDHVAPLARNIIADPFEMLKEDFNNIICSDHAREGFSALEDGNASSLRIFVGPVISEEVPPAIRRSEDQAVLEAFVTDLVKTTAQTEYWRLIGVSDYASTPSSEVKLHAA